MPNKEIKNPMPKGLKELTLAFDVSTTKTGYAFLANKEPIIGTNGKPMIGSLSMVKDPKQKHTSYGDRMGHNSTEAFNVIRSLVSQLLTPLTTTYYEMKQQGKEFKINKINIVFEVSEIPTFGKNSGQTLTTVRKLALYVGAVLALVSQTVELSFEPFKNQIEWKLVKPGEWQDRLWSKKEATALNEYSGKSLKQKGSKIMSIKFANKYLESMGLTPITNGDDDMADAINIATQASQLRDNLFAKGQAKKKTNQIKSFESEIRKLETKLAEYKQIALEAKNVFVDEVIWANTIDRNTLETQSDKVRHTKYVKYDIEDTRIMELTEFFTPAQLRQWNKWTIKVADLKEQIVKLRGENVITKTQR